MTGIKLKKVLLSILFILFFLIVYNKCSFHTLPDKKVKSINIKIEEKYNDNGYQLIIKNPLECPNRFFLSCEDQELNKFLNDNSPLILDPKSDTTLIIKGKGDLRDKIKLKFKWGNPERPIRTSIIKSLPFPKDKSYKLLQGNNSNPTHNHNLSRYAFDFTMKIGDTITSTQNGYVVSVIDAYKGWGYSDKWKPFSNQLMIYDTVSNLFTMYGHLKQYGSLVELGQFVEIGEPIALSGKTGQTSEEHLHFNVLQADHGKIGLKSFPLDSIGDYKVKELKRFQLMKN